MTDETVAPMRQDERIDTLDVLRGVAICGILLMNIPAMGMIGDTALPALPIHWNLDGVVFSVQRVLFAGTMRGLFTMLFGAGMLLMLRRTFEDAPQITAIDVWTRRCLALMVLGVVQFALFFWPGEILWNYGLCGLALLAFRTARPRALLSAAGIALLALCALLAWQRAEQVAALETAKPVAAARAAGQTLTPAQIKIVAPFDGVREMMAPTPTAVADEYRERTHLPTLFAWSWDGWFEYNLAAGAWTWNLESLCFMLFGMALYRTGVLTGAAAPSVYWRLILIGYPLGLALRAYLLWYGVSSSFDLDAARIVPVHAVAAQLLTEPARLLITLGHVGLIVTLFRSGMLGQAWPLRALGRMALTVYSLQSILTSILFYGFGYVGVFGFAALMGIAALIWLVTALFCIVWLRHHDMGPAERLLRAVAYASFRRHRPAAGAVLATTPAI